MLPVMVGGPVEQALDGFAGVVLDHAIGRPVLGWWRRRQGAKRAKALARGDSVSLVVSYRSSQVAPWQRGTVTITATTATWQHGSSSVPVVISSASIFGERLVGPSGAKRPAAVIFSCRTRDGSFDLAAAGADASVLRGAMDERSGTEPA